MSSAADLYQRDFFAWSTKNAELLRRGQLSELDVEHLAEELESMGKSERRELINRLAVLMAHLMKWRSQPGLRSNSWRYTVKEQRRQIGYLLEDSPSLHQHLRTRFDKVYEHAVLLAAREMGLEEGAFPREPPFTFEQAIAPDFWPEEESQR